MSSLKEKVIKAKEVFGDKAINVIVNDLNIEGWDDTKKAGRCPFHEEKTASFQWNPKDNAFKCFGCGIRYGIVDHYQRQGLSFRQSVEKLFRETHTDYIFNDAQKKNYRYPKPEENNTKTDIYTYLNARKISRETVDFTNVKQDRRGNIVFEYYDESNKLLTVKYRPSRKLHKGENKNWCQKDADTSPILWGMNQIVFEKPLIIVEGEIDRLSLIESGILNVVSVPFGAGNYSWIEYNWNWLENFDEIIICADNDEAGTKMINEVIPRLGEWRCKVVDYPEPAIHKGKKKKLTDANEVLYFLGTKAIHEMIENAKEVPIKNVVNLAEVKDIDLSKAQGIKSGIKELDKRIAKFFFGTLAVWTGINGSGKSTLINQVGVVEALNQGYKTFVFSGELTKQQLRNWIEYPMAGSNHIGEKQIADDQPVFYRVKENAKDAMRNWYNNKIFLYDDDLDKSATSLMKTMEIMARKHGVKNFLIDNLMTVDISNYKGDSIWDKQKEFVLDLMRFCIKFNVLVHLVAHPRKLDFVKRLTKMDVSGTGDITNLAHYVLAVHRVTQQEKEGVKNKQGDWITEPIEYDALLDVFKNRPIGFQDFVIGLYFDRKSKRFYKSNEDLYKRYRWDTSKQRELKVAIEGDEDNLPF